MSDRCHVCGPVKHEAPTVICAPCALREEQIERSRQAKLRLEALVPIADAIRALAAIDDVVNRPFSPAVYTGLTRWPR